MGPGPEEHHQPVILTKGSFDPPHRGHKRLFDRLAVFGEVVVGVNSDRFYQQYRGEAPMVGEAERMRRISEYGYRTELNDGPGRDLIEKIRPDYVAVGSDWLPGRKDFLTQIDMTADDLEALEIGLIFLPRTPGISSTQLRARAGMFRVDDSDALDRGAAITSHRFE